MSKDLGIIIGKTICSWGSDKTVDVELYISGFDGDVRGRCIELTIGTNVIPSNIQLDKKACAELIRIIQTYYESD